MNAIPLTAGISMLSGTYFDQHLPNVDLSSWTPRQAYANFMARYEELLA